MQKNDNVVIIQHIHSKGCYQQPFFMEIYYSEIGSKLAYLNAGASIDRGEEAVLSSILQVLF